MDHEGNDPLSTEQHPLFHRRNHERNEERFRATSFDRDISLRIPLDDPLFGYLFERTLGGVVYILLNKRNTSGCI